MNIRALARKVMDPLSMVDKTEFILIVLDWLDRNALEKIDYKTHELLSSKEKSSAYDMYWV